jgi:hypothetical protein
MVFKSIGFAFCCIALATAANAQDPAPGTGEPYEEIQVTGEFPGPGMWKVTRVDDAAGHVLWIVGGPPPLPKRMKWRSAQVEAVALRSQEVLMDSGFNVALDEKLGVFRGLSILPAALKARKNPDEQTLRELLPPDLYQRWLVQKKRYLGSDSGIEKWRPLLAAQKLQREAIDDLGLSTAGDVWKSVGKLVEKNKIKTTSPLLKFKFPADDLKARIKEFTHEKLADTECFSTTLDLVEALANTAVEERRAHAWATGDLATLESLPALPNPQVPCAVAVLSSQVAREYVPADLREQLMTLWLEAAGKSLDANQTTLAFVPLAKLTRKDGYLERLRARGYLIEAPK